MVLICKKMQSPVSSLVGSGEEYVNICQFIFSPWYFIIIFPWKRA